MSRGAANPRSVAVAVDGVPRPRWAGALARFCVRALESAGYRAWEVSILLCDDRRMRGFNARYRGLDRPTDVLSFGDSPPSAAAPMLERVVRGDIAISLDTLRRNAAAYGVSEEEELQRLLVHGLLHLAGMDHGKGKGRGMLARQERLLAELRAERVILRRPGASGKRASAHGAQAAREDPA